MELKVFLDTMVFLHFRPLDELGLKTLLRTDNITLVVPRVTLRELDKHKSSHPSQKIRDRARRALNDLETAITKSEFLGQLGIEYFATYPKEQLQRLNLNEAW